MVIQITSESLGCYRPQEQIAVVKETRPEAVSLALREFVPTEAHETEFSSFLSWLKVEAIVPQIILYDAEEAFRLAEYCRRGLVPWSQVPVLFVLGRYSAVQKSNPVDLLPFINGPMSHFAHWSVCAFGAREAACVTAAALLGGHVRVGFENNRQLPGGEFAKSNAELVAGVSKILMELGLRRANADELRRAWQLG
ncbi:uncharacterized protein (DUF849 family) [Sinorhizobium kostiense]|uniref:Uncharacterized protein (DUF849 family) n=2 Tax=Sinorhizobium kostiense TaxID=76747 RepID=A0ABS4R802_9HYPH|nr:uncharacterized protein (DUF849 family) [Sinorhizobium kostiense]